MNRQDRNRAVTVIVAVCLGLLALWGCPKKTEVVSAPEPQREESAVTRQTPTAEPAPPAVSEHAAEEAPAPAPGLQPVFFDFDKSFIRPDAGEALKANAEWLKAHPQARIRIEGNCDERGTTEYNQALGQRRAASAKKFLTDLGISAARMSLISFGKEKPVCTDSTESCWQKNRRDDVVAVE